ncbi:AGAP012000-PA-like protein [Anopheles sinensis]|uniref:AGAP012000-PA-like protein n=1 Tax=Anopheles sinensis TaxID=74873 RepID=A0A084WMT6_ANOSI|nr:AGAP012000-PA-like protein [Anopheles sinensis]
MVKNIVKVLIFVVFCGLFPSRSNSEHTTGQEPEGSEWLKAHLAAFESRIEAKLIARIEEKLLSRIEDLANSAKTAFEQKLGDISTRISGLESIVERTCEQNTSDVKQLIQETLLPRIENYENNVLSAQEQTVTRITRLVKDETNHLQYVVNHPGVFRETLWTPIQRRFDGSTDFQRNWTEYRNGFGNPHGEHWLGLEKLYDLLRRHQHELLIVLEDFEGVIAHAHYSHFRIGSESERYAIKSLGEYSGTAGDALRLQEGAPFSTQGAATNGGSSELTCASLHQGGWWYWKFPWCTKRYGGVLD